jgi:hypothetical protein
MGRFKPYRLTEARIRRGIEAARAGQTDPGIAGAMGCKKTRYYELLIDNTELAESIQAAKDEANAKVVKMSFHRAIGYDYDETTQELVPVYKDGKITGRELRVTKIVTKKLPAEYNYARLWLLNRAPKDWRDKSELGLDADVILLNAPI